MNANTQNVALFSLRVDPQVQPKIATAQKQVKRWLDVWQVDYGINALWTVAYGEETFHFIVPFIIAPHRSRHPRNYIAIYILPPLQGAQKTRFKTKIMCFSQFWTGRLLVLPTQVIALQQSAAMRSILNEICKE